MGNQLIATLITSTGGLKKISEMAKAGGWELGTGFLPRHKEFGVTTGGGGLGMFKRVPKERKQAAAEFVRFLARPENAAQWTVQTGYMPVVRPPPSPPRWRSCSPRTPTSPPRSSSCRTPARATRCG
ncbi:extracellular solute-binding protein [Streptomyces sp. FXJ1.4098]|nr:extracellular solute-binding protein [Streptomyces sp. FXJ1.4098]